ncbi:7-cyano-7-deazaguanine synthase [Caulobacter ginsengisoli]|uniref:7-cyano-7-deazaguanine synthase n=1 Tax=Caulobacter ginsengisoli TaxID=400775 RepID=A0ABU0ING3_9CAUL|nr:7-cyano-7-deazaguanine synthase [Caulobacter ginsengisoli]MDQ0462512.1 7-cyano-7-deazaguanine synthase [Caulobacter ginsengisoli]
MAKRILILHSGGMDSTTCLYQAVADGAEVFSLGIDYGQRLSVELMYAAQHCTQLGVPREVVSVAWQKPDRDIPLGRDVAEMSKTVSTAFLPARNVLLLSVACAHASGIGAEEVHTGLNCVEFSGYPDCTVEFFESFKAMMQIANPGGPAIVAPLLTMTKVEIAARAKALGIGEFDTWSCYRPQISTSGVEPCHTCDACVLHEHAWRELA